MQKIADFIKISNTKIEDKIKLIEKKLNSNTSEKELKELKDLKDDINKMLKVVRRNAKNPNKIIKAESIKKDSNVFEWKIFLSHEDGDVGKIRSALEKLHVIGSIYIGYSQSIGDITYRKTFPMVGTPKILSYLT